MKSIKRIRILYWVSLIVFGWIIFIMYEGSGLLKLTAFGVVVILVEIISRREMAQAIKDEKEELEEELEEKRLKGVAD